ncbi:hypothetical protein Q7P35_006699 [Cladosporium inversicolor]
MYFNSYSSRRSGSRYYPIIPGSGYLTSRFDDDASAQMEYMPSRHRRNERSHGVGSGMDERRSADTSRSGHGTSRDTTHSSGYGPSYISSRSSMDRGPSRSRASTRASTVYPDDSISNIGRRPHRQRDAEIRGRSVAPTGHRGQRITEGYPPTLPSTSSRSSRRSHTFDSGPTYTYLPPSGSGMVFEVASNISSSSVTHPFAYDYSSMTRTWHPTPRYQFSETSHRAHRSDAPSPESRASHGQTSTSAYRSAASGRSRRTSHPSYSVCGCPPPSMPVLRCKSGGNFFSNSSAMEDPA